MRLKIALVVLAAALLSTVIPGAATAATTYTCPNQVRAQDPSTSAIVTVNLSAQSLNVFYNLFSSGTNGWSAMSDASFIVPCKVAGQVINQGSRVLLSCSCTGTLNNSPISGSATYTVAGGSQCTYQGNLQFQCN